MPTISDILTKFVNEHEKITEVIAAGSEYYFRYGDHAFSVLERSDDANVGPYSLYVYPSWKGPLSQLAESYADQDAEEPDLVGYHTNELPRLTDKNNLARLHKLLQEKQLNVDQVFKDILAT